jgi:hypothetical protein
MHPITSIRADDMFGPPVPGKLAAIHDILISILRDSRDAANRKIRGI